MVYFFKNKTKKKMFESHGNSVMSAAIVTKSVTPWKWLPYVAEMYITLQFPTTVLSVPFISSPLFIFFIHFSFFHCIYLCTNNYHVHKLTPFPSKCPTLPCLTCSPPRFQRSCDYHWPASRHVAHTAARSPSAASGIQTAESCLHGCSWLTHHAMRTEPLLSGKRGEKTSSVNGIKKQSCSKQLEHIHEIVNTRPSHTLVARTWWCCSCGCCGLM